MTDPGVPLTNRFHEALNSADALATFETERFGIGTLWPRLNALAEETTEPATKELFELLGRTSSMYVRPDEWNSPYGPLSSSGDMRTTIHTDFNEDEIAILREAVPQIPHALLRARVYDVLALLAVPRDRLQFHLAHLDALLQVPISQESWGMEHDAWDRGLLVARRLGKPTRTRLRDLDRALRAAMASTSDGFFPIRVADLLRKHGLGRDRAGVVARRLARIARAEKTNLERSRAYHAASAAWFIWAGDRDASYKETLLEVETLIAEAELELGPDGRPGMQSAYRFERALRALRTIPKAARQELGIAGMAADIARRIREAGAAALGEMRAFTSDAIDLSEAAREARERVTGLSPEEALLAFVRLSGFASFESEKEQAEKLIAEHPFQSLFSNVHFSSDGRVVYRSSGQGGTPIYGVDPATWRQMNQSYGVRISFLSTGAFWPGYQQLTNEHHLGLSDFLAITADAGIVPTDRITQVARGLYYGYDGDFSTAMQLLVPQIENLVRHHMGNAGQVTTYITEGGLEMEVGLSALMEREAADDVLGVDLAFEIRALLCGPIGPNLRNEVAHGLVSDATAGGVFGLYCWWFALRLVYVPFWNQLHDTEAAEAREPAQRHDDEDEGTTVPEDSETDDTAPSE